jgi:hypothetical protein
MTLKIETPARKTQALVLGVELVLVFERLPAKRVVKSIITGRVSTPS